jgi:hypothetical protein
MDQNELMAKCGNEHCNHTRKAHTYVDRGKTLLDFPCAYTGCNCRVFIKKA